MSYAPTTFQQSVLDALAHDDPNHPTPVRLIAGGLSSGKSTTLVLAACALAAKTQGVRILLATRRHSLAWFTLGRPLSAHVRHDPAWVMEPWWCARSNPSQSEIHLTGLAGAFDSAHLNPVLFIKRGKTWRKRLFDALLIDNIHDLARDDFDALLQHRKPSGCIIATAFPGPGWVADDWIHHPQPGYVVLTTNLHDNPYLSNEWARDITIYPGFEPSQTLGGSWS